MWQKKIEKIEAVLFDMDGLLLDTESMSQRASRRAAACFGYELDQAFSLGLIGRNGKDAKKRFQEIIAPDFPYSEYEKAFYQHYDREVKEKGIPVMKGVSEVFEILHEINIPSAIATSTHRAKALEKLKATGLLAKVEQVVAGDQVEQGKPFPDIYLKAAENLGVKPEKCLVLEDSHPGVRAGHASGAVVVMVPDLLPPTEEVSKLADGIISSLLDLIPSLKKLKQCRTNEM
ncbi:MAG: HAD family phosphatase [Verrucomicrobiota bacterium]